MLRFYAEPEKPTVRMFLWTTLILICCTMQACMSTQVLPSGCAPELSPDPVRPEIRPTDKRPTWGDLRQLCLEQAASLDAERCRAAIRRGEEPPLSCR